MRNLLPVSLFGQRAWLPLLIAMVLVVVYLPLLSAGFYSDDWTFLAWSKHGDGPLGFFIYDHSFTYMYRPVAMTSWWGMTLIAGLEAHWHYLFALLVHTGSSLLGVLWLRRQGASTFVQVLALLALLAHPTSGATVAWLADRFDLMMSFGVMLGIYSLSHLDEQPRRAFLGLMLGLLVAVGSKETGLILVPIGLSGLLLSALSGKRKFVYGSVVLLFTALYFAARKLVLGSLGGITSGDSVIAPFVNGAWLWFENLPQALAGQGSPAALGVVLLLLLAVLLCALLWNMNWAQRLVVAQLLMVVAGLAVLQAPVTQIVLDQPEPFRSVVNFRFYYLAILALILLVTYLLAQWPKSSSRAYLLPVSAVLSLPLLACWLWWGHTAVVHWSGWTGAQERDKALAAVNALVQDPDLLAMAAEPATCLVRMQGVSQVHSDVHGYSDLMLKAHLDRNSPLVNCVFASEKEPWKAISLWQEGVITGSVNGLSQNRSDSYRSGRLALHTKLARDADKWRWKSYCYASDGFTDKCL